MSSVRIGAKMAFFRGFGPRRAAVWAEQPFFSFAIIFYHPKEHSLRVSALYSKIFLNYTFGLDISRSVIIFTEYNKAWTSPNNITSTPIGALKVKFPIILGTNDMPTNQPANRSTDRRAHRGSYTSSKGAQFSIRKENNSPIPKKNPINIDVIRIEY